MSRLPSALFQMRLEREINDCKTQVEDNIFISCKNNFQNPPITIEINITNLKAPKELYSTKNNKFKYTSSHRFQISIDREYPYKPPEVKWLTPILHPNIAHPREGGKVCIKTLGHWNPETNILQLINSIVNLLTHPNPKCPLDLPSCTFASKLYNSGVITISDRREARFEVSIKGQVKSTKNHPNPRPLVPDP